MTDPGSPGTEPDQSGRDGPRIVVGVDGSEPSLRALEWALAEARSGGGTLHLLSAWVFPMAYGYAFTSTVAEVQQAAQDVIDQSIHYVHQLAPEIDVTGETTEQMPAQALVAASASADLLVVGSRGRGGFEGMLLGSVSQHCAAPRRLLGGGGALRRRAGGGRSGAVARGNDRHRDRRMLGQLEAGAPEQRPGVGTRAP